MKMKINVGATLLIPISTTEISTSMALLFHRHHQSTVTTLHRPFTLLISSPPPSLSPHIFILTHRTLIKEPFLCRMNPNDDNSPKFSSPSSMELDSGTGSAPVPMGCLQGTPVPPFLSKTFDLVDEPALDPIISWGNNGVSFVVWDPLEFSRIVLPRHFKHNNFSSFVRQLNTYGFRKIDSDKWEFFNDAFQRGKKHLLKNIQRRRSHHSQQVGSYVGSSSDAGKFGVEVEIEKLRKERSVLMQEVVDLQQQQRETVQHAGEVNQRLQSAEERQKQMVSFLAKLFQNPSFLARLKQNKKEQRGIESPRVRKKFLKQHQHETGTSDKDQIVRYQPDWRDITTSAETPELSPVSIEHSPHYLSQDLAREMSVENIASDELAAALPVIMPTQEIFGDGPSSFGLEDPLLKGKNVMSPNQEALPEYILSFAEVSTEEKGFPEFSPLETESTIKQEDLWDPEFNVDVAVSSSGNELWGNPTNYGVSDFGVTSGFSESDMWDIGFGSLGIDQWPADESPLGEIAHQPKDDRPKNE